MVIRKQYNKSDFQKAQKVLNKMYDEELLLHLFNRLWCIALFYFFMLSTLDSQINDIIDYCKLCQENYKLYVEYIKLLKSAYSDHGLNLIYLKRMELVSYNLKSLKLVSAITGTPHLEILQNIKRYLSDLILLLKAFVAIDTFLTLTLKIILKKIYYEELFLEASRQAELRIAEEEKNKKLE